MIPSHRRITRAQRLGLTAALVTGLSWIGCTDQASVTPTSLDDSVAAEAHTGPPLALQERNLGPALAAQRRHGPRLKAIPGVVGHGVGLVNGEPGIKVFLLTPGVAGIPSRLDGLPVGVEVTGMFVADDLSDPQSWERPAPNGFSIGHPDITAGTLGAIVKDPEGVCYALSNNHVLANSNEATIGDSSLQPGPFDGGQDPVDAIGTLADFEAIDFDGGNNEIDAAISELLSPDAVLGVTPDYAYGAPGTVAVTAALHMKLKKFGRTTGLTYGSVIDVNVTADVCYECAGPWCRNCKKLATFVGQIATGDMSNGGDSGSLIVTDDGANNPVGLLFAGSSSRTLANPIGPVFARFGASIQTDMASCTNGSGVNAPPVADFTFTTTDLTADFTDASSDSDGTVASWDWNFGDGNTSTDQNPSHTYASAGTYTVTLTVTDDDLATDTYSQDATVSQGGGGITLSASGFTAAPWLKVDLTWTGAATSKVAVFRNEELVATTTNDGAYTDKIRIGGGTTFTHRICEVDGKTPTSVCSNPVNTVF